MVKTLLQPVAVSDTELQREFAIENINFRLIRRIVGMMPKGKVRAADLLGKKILRNPRGIASTAAGFKIAIDESNICFFGALLKHGGVWEDQVSRICIERLRPGQVFYDIGANSGYVSLRIASHHEDTIHISAFEPQPRLARLLAASATLNGFCNISAYRVMLGTETKETNLYLDRSSTHATAVERTPGMNSIRCPQVTLDAVVDSRQILPPRLIKMDVEGAEMNVFKGAVELIRKHQPDIVFESGKDCTRFGYTREDIMAFIRSLGDYEIYCLDKKAQLVPTNCDRAHEYSNLVAISSRV